jgi:hypothetical protein
MFKIDAVVVEIMTNSLKVVRIIIQTGQVNKPILQVVLHTLLTDKISSTKDLKIKKEVSNVSILYI